MQKIWADSWVKMMTNIEEIIEIIKEEDRVIKVDIMDDECKKSHYPTRNEKTGRTCPSYQQGS